MATFSVGQAARLVGCGKTTITRAIKSGRISAERLDDGSYRIDGSELMRVYSIKAETLEQSHETVSEVHHATPSVTPPETPVTPDVTARLAALDAEVKGLRELLTEVRDSRDQWRTQAERLSLMAPEAKTDRRPWWRRLAG
jgi:excisionase family DNA binding protein